ncbi:MAG: DUF2341 domain-containing protein [Nevskia sp.]|nr:DUF2341 domain-containing protein [Nevskia sp.]
MLALLLFPALAHAWWNKDWKERTKVVLNTSPAGVETKETVSGLAVPVRLHSGNFDFLSAKTDASDLRFVAGDDKTPLKFWIERYDSVNELAVVWVQVPAVLPGTDKNIVYAYAGNDQATVQGDPASAVFDSSTLAVFHFGEKDGVATDQSGTVKATGAVTNEPNGLIGPSARFIGSPITFPASSRLGAPAAGPLTVSLWVHPDTAQGVLFNEGTLTINLNAGHLNATVGGTSVAGGDVAAAVWSQVVLTLGGGKLSLYVNGAQVGQGDAGTQNQPIAGDIKLGDGYQGLIDEVVLASTVRSADWIKLAYASQASDAKLIASNTETADTAEAGEGSQSYFGILFKNLTPDGWAVIGILFIMFLIAVWVMVGKALFLVRVDGANHKFLRRFRDAEDVLNLDGGSVGAAAVAQGPLFRHSTIYRVYQAGLRELGKRNIGHGGKPLSGPGLDAVKASIDADMVRENHRLNARMVLLTIAIAGGPFLGLLGTVVGVMITFAAIAAAGDVNVNAIAPGIAAALLATVAGLTVAIPSLFGYNYLASRIKVVSSDMQIFVDEFVTRVAELYGER